LANIAVAIFRDDDSELLAVPIDISVGSESEMDG
jgi:hypothetical protein